MRRCRAVVARSAILARAAICTAAFATWTAVTAAAAAIVAGSATVTAATIRTIAAGTIATRFARFACRARVFQRFAGFLINDAHRQADFAARVDFEHLDLDGLAFLETTSVGFSTRSLRISET